MPSVGLFIGPTALALIQKALSLQFYPSDFFFKFLVKGLCVILIQTIFGERDFDFWLDVSVFSCSSFNFDDCVLNLVIVFVIETS